MASFDWIFFDCFNTLIDDFDPSGDESGMTPVHDLAIASGLYNSVAEFGQDYLQWRQVELMGQGYEIPLPERLTALLRRRSPQMPKDQLESLVTKMVHAFVSNYPSTLRLPPGLDEMLNHWHGKVAMGVISNFHMADLPRQMLEQFGLDHHFEFILDSATCGWRKPGPEIYHAAFHLAGVSETAVGNILFVGDHLDNDVLMPLELGMQAIYFDRSGDRPSSARAPDHVSAITHWDQFRSSEP